MQKFVATYDDMAKAEAIARANGWKEGDGFLDYLNDCYPHTSRTFPTKSLAEAWLMKQLEAGLSLFGCGDIDVIEEVPYRARCTYCTCRGWKEVQSFLCEETGITEEREVSDECAYDD